MPYGGRLPAERRPRPGPGPRNCPEGGERPAAPPRIEACWRTQRSGAGSMAAKRSAYSARWSRHKPSGSPAEGSEQPVRRHGAGLASSPM